jgi:hypothetical protein
MNPAKQNEIFRMALKWQNDLQAADDLVSRELEYAAAS